MSAAPQSDGLGQAPKSLPLILARELAANLATPMFLIDAEGMLVFCNEAAELMLGKTFSEVGELTAAEFGDMLHLENPDGSALPSNDSPPGVAFWKREPAHAQLLATTLGENRKTAFEVTAYPLFGRTGDMHGVLTVFWEAAE
jgi:PAS domain-containing protein